MREGDKDTNKKYIFDAIELGEKASIRGLVSNGQNLNFVLDGDTPLKWAIKIHPDNKTKSLEIMQLLLDLGEQINHKDANGNTILHFIACNVTGESQLHLLNFVVISGADINNKNKRGETPLDVANSNTALLFLIEHGAISNNNKAFLWRVAEHGDEQCWDYISKSKIPLSKDCELLYYAIQNDNLKNFKYLVSEGLDANCEIDELSLINYAVDANAIECLKYMFELGIECEPDDFGDPLLHQLAVTGENTNIELIRLVASASGGIDGHNELGETALHVACENNNTKFISALIELGANVNAEGPNGISPIQHLVQKAFCPSNKPTVELLLKNGAVLSHRNTDGENICFTALSLINSHQYTGCMTNLDSLNYFISKGADYTQTNIKGENLLQHYLVNNDSFPEKHQDVIDYLESLGLLR